MKKKMTEEEIVALVTKNIDDNKENIIKLMEGLNTFPLWKETLAGLIKSAGYPKPKIKKWYLEMGGMIKCDAKDCDFRKDEGNLDLIYLWNNVPCPKCGANLLTDKDLNSILTLNTIIGSPILRFINWIGKKFNLKSVKYRTEMDGSGKITLKKSDEKEVINHYHWEWEGKNDTVNN